MLYTSVKLSVSSDQLEKLKRDIESGKKKNLSIKIQLKDKHGQRMPEQHTLLLTRGQLASIEKVRAHGHRRFKVIRMSERQVKKNMSHTGGILGFLASLASRALPALAKGVVTGLISGVGKEIGSGGGGDGLYLFKRGNCIKVDPVKGNGLYLRSHHSGNSIKGDGLYIKRGDSLESVGNGLILGKNSPFKNIPILGWIL